MNSTKTLLTALIVSLFSLASLQGFRLLQTPDSQVLGATTVNTSTHPVIDELRAPATTNGVPCTLINTWQKQYCSSNVPTAIPSIQPVCTPVPCPKGQALFCPISGGCPGGCGFICGSPTPTPAPLPTGVPYIPSHPTPTPTPQNSGPFKLTLTNPTNEITCQVSDPNCYYQTVVTGTNQTSHTFYSTTLWTTGSNISYYFNGAEISDGTPRTSSLVVDPGQDAFNTLVRVTHPNQVGTYYSYFYANSTVCNSSKPLVCSTYPGGSSFYVKINVTN